MEIYIAAWRDCADRLLSLVRTLSDEQWALETDCPGWTVRDVVAHLADLETELADGRPRDFDGRARELRPDYTEVGVRQRKDMPPAELVAELAAAVDKRAGALEADPPTDPNGAPAHNPGGLEWDWHTLLRNRVVDVWVHEQDIRRAVGMPGGLDSPAAQVTTTTFSMAMPFVLGKKVHPPAGTSIVWEVAGEVPITVAAVVGDDGRGQRMADPPSDPSAVLRMDTETFTALCAGRRDPLVADVGIEGDRGLASSVLAQMAVTP